MDYQYIKAKEQNGILYITLNRPDKLNAINFQMVEELSAVLKTLDFEQTRAVFITGNEKAFSSGGDLKEMKTLQQPEAKRRSDFIHSTFRELQNLPIPTIAFISGICFGGGFELALHCDIRICSSDARLALPELQYGIIPGAGGTVQLPLQMGCANAAWYLFTGNEIPLDIALHSGIIQQVIPTQDFSEAEKKLVHQFTNTQLEAIKAIKEQLIASRNHSPMDVRYQTESTYFAQLLAQFGKEGIGQKF